MMKRPLVFVDFLADGHHSAYMGHLVRFAMAHGSTSLSFLLSRDLYHNALTHMCAEERNFFNPRVQLIDDDPVWLRVVRWSPRIEVAYWLYFECLNWRERKRSRLLFLYLEAIIYPLALVPLPRFHISGLLFRPTFYYRQRHMLALGATSGALFVLKWLVGYLCALRPGIERVFVFDPLAEEYAASVWHSRKFPCVPDPMGPEAIGLRPVGSAQPIVARPLILLLAGALSPRKGLHWLVDALAQCSESTRARVRLVVVGRPEQGFADYVTQHLTRLRELKVATESHIQFVSDEEMDRHFTVAHIILTPYMGFKGSSGIIIRAAHFGKPVISTNEGLLGYLVERRKLGEALDVANVEHFSRDLARVVTTGVVNGFTPASARAFDDSNDPQEFCRAVCSPL